MSIMNELGRIGQKRYGGFFYEEFLRELQGRKGVELSSHITDYYCDHEAIDIATKPGGSIPHAPLLCK